MSALLVGYARCSTDQQDLTAQRDGLQRLGVQPGRIYVDHGLTGTNRERPGLREALAACRAGDTLVVTKLDRLARSLPDAREIADELTARQISLARRVGVRPDRRRRPAAVQRSGDGGRVRVRSDPAAHREGMKVAKAKGRLGASSPSSTASRKPTWSSWYTAASTARWRSPNCSAWALDRYRAIERQRVAVKAGLAEAASRR